MLERIDDWRDAPVWEPASIAARDQQLVRAPRRFARESRVRSGRCRIRRCGARSEAARRAAIASPSSTTTSSAATSFANVRGAAGLREIEGDVRDRDAVVRALAGCDAVIHLACVSNDPSYELDPELSKSINYDCFPMFVEEAKRAGVQALHLRFVEFGLRRQRGARGARGPSAAGADRLLEVQGAVRADRARREPSRRLHDDGIAPGDRVRGLDPDALRPLGEHPHEPRHPQPQNHRLRRLAAAPEHAHRGRDRSLRQVLLEPADRIAGKTYNAGYQNRSIADIAAIVRTVVRTSCRRSAPIEIVTHADRRHALLPRELRTDRGGTRFTPRLHDRGRGARHLRVVPRRAFPEQLEDPRYFNVRTLKQQATPV